MFFKLDFRTEVLHTTVYLLYMYVTSYCTPSCPDVCESFEQEVLFNRHGGSLERGKGGNAISSPHTGTSERHKLDGMERGEGERGKEYLGGGVLYSCGLKRSFSPSPTNSALLINLRMISDAEILLISTDCSKQISAKTCKKKTV